MKNRILLFFTLILICTVIYSQDDSIISVDHSRVTLSTDIVPLWKVQVEVGGTSWYSEDTRTYDPGTHVEQTVSDYHLMMDIPTLAFRVGIFRNIELRLGLVFKQEFIRTKYDGIMTIISSSFKRGIYGGGPIEAGIKYNFLERNIYLPEASLSVNLFIPAGNYYFHMDYISPLFKLILKRDINKKFSVGGNLGYGWNVYDDFTDKYGSYSVSLNASLSSKLSAFAEAFSYFQHKRKPDHRIGAGLTYRFARNVMTVVQGGFGISERAPDLFGSGGIGFIFP